MITSRNRSKVDFRLKLALQFYVDVPEDVVHTFTPFDLVASYHSGK